MERQVCQDAGVAEANGEVVDLKGVVQMEYPDRALLAPPRTSDNRFTRQPFGGSGWGDAPERQTAAELSAIGGRVRTQQAHQFTRETRIHKHDVRAGRRGNAEAGALPSATTTTAPSPRMSVSNGSAAARSKAPITTSGTSRREPSCTQSVCHPASRGAPCLGVVWCTTRRGEATGRADAQESVPGKAPRSGLVTCGNRARNVWLS